MMLSRIVDALIGRKVPPANGSGCLPIDLQMATAELDAFLVRHATQTATAHRANDKIEASIRRMTLSVVPATVRDQP